MALYVTDVVLCFCASKVSWWIESDTWFRPVDCQNSRIPPFSWDSSAWFYPLEFLVGLLSEIA